MKRHGGGDKRHAKRHGGGDKRHANSAASDRVWLDRKRPAASREPSRRRRHHAKQRMERHWLRKDQRAPPGRLTDRPCPDGPCPGADGPGLHDGSGLAAPAQAGLYGCVAQRLRPSKAANGCPRDQIDINVLLLPCKHRSGRGRGSPIGEHLSLGRHARLSRCARCRPWPNRPCPQHVIRGRR
jgi:hypothetical protein